MENSPHTVVMQSNSHSRRVLVENLKKCPVCGALNMHDSSSCFVCDWHGNFEHDPIIVEAGLDEMLLRCPQLVDAMMIETDCPLPLVFRIKNLLRKIWMGVRSKFAKKSSRRLDLKI